MSIATNRDRYDAVTIALHWAMAAAVIAAYALGLIREEMPRGDARTLILTLHVSIGVLILLGAALRLGWRSLHPAPAATETGRLAALAARLGHLALYAGMMGVPVLGILAVWAEGRGLRVFGVFSIASPFTADRDWAHALEDAHAVAAHLLIGLAGLHAVAALAHHYILKDGVLARMSPSAGAGKART